MDLISKLRLKAQNALARQNDIVKAAEGAGREFTADEQKEYDQLAATIKADLAKIDREKARAEAEAAIAAPTATVVPETVNRDVTGAVAGATAQHSATGGPAFHTAHTQKLTWTQEMGLFAWAAAKQKHVPIADPYKHLDDAGFKTFGDAGRSIHARMAQEKSLISISGGGANTIVTPLSNDFIEFLRNSSAFLVGNPIQLDMSNGAIDIPGGNVGASGTYGAEGANIGYSELTTRKVNLASKHLRALTAVGNYLIAVSPLNVATIAGDDLANSLVTSLDAAGLRGDGTGSNPAGLRSLVSGGQLIAVAAGTSPAYTVVLGYIKQMVAAIRTSNVPERRRRWVMAGRVFTFLEYLVDANGNRIFPGLSKPVPELAGYPVTMSEQVPTILGAGTNESEIYLADFGHVLMGVSRALQLTSSTEASYINASATLVSAFSLDETVIRGVMSHDFDLRHAKACVIATAVQWA